jgi:hypothetical protein
MKKGESVIQKQGMPPEDFLTFLEIMNDYRGYESFEGYINDILQENLKEIRNKYNTFHLSDEGYNEAYFMTLQKFNCPPFKEHFLKGRELSELSHGFMSWVVGKFETYYGLKEVFGVLMLTVEELIEANDYPPKEDVAFNMGQVPVLMHIDTNGFYYEKKITEIFYGVDFSKVRRCICGNYFWAYRKDKNACSSICGNRVRQQKFLSDEKKAQEYREKRLKYYHDNKEDIRKRKMKKKEKKNNGTL